MKLLFSISTAAILLAGAASPARADVSVSIDLFHDNLASAGDWREVGSYGYCWQPRSVDRNWRPYRDGHWLYTDAGWTWASDEPYSWAVYHYGRWAQVDSVGWVWVPGTEWAPAWVSWRGSPEHIGWAPLPPEAVFDASVGFNGQVDASFDIGPMNYCFVNVRDFGAPNLGVVIIDQKQNLTFISETTNITRISSGASGIMNGGPNYDAISRQTAQPIRRLTLDRSQGLAGDPHSVTAAQLKSKIEGNSLHVAALPVDAKPGSAPKKVGAPVPKAVVDHGWKNAGPAAEVAKLRAKIKSEPATAAAAAPAPAKPAAATAAAKSEKPAVAPARPGDPVAAAKPEKPVNPAAGRARTAPTVATDAGAGIEAKKPKSEGIEATPPTAEGRPKAQAPGPKAETENAEPPRSLPSAEAGKTKEKIKPEKEEAAKPEARHGTEPAVKKPEKASPKEEKPRKDEKP